MPPSRPGDGNVPNRGKLTGNALTVGLSPRWPQVRSRKRLLNNPAHARTLNLGGAPLRRPGAGPTGSIIEQKFFAGEHGPCRPPRETETAYQNEGLLSWWRSLARYRDTPLPRRLASNAVWQIGIRTGSETDSRDVRALTSKASHGVSSLLILKHGASGGRLHFQKSVSFRNSANCSDSSPR